MEDVFYARAAQAGDEFRKHTLSYSVGVLGAFFISLTGEHASTTLKGPERTVLLCAIAAFALATLSGLLAWYFAGRYFHKRAERGENAAKLLHLFKNIFDVSLVVLFGIGVMASATYLWIKIA